MAEGLGQLGPLTRSLDPRPKPAILKVSSVQFSHSVMSTLCDPMDCSTPGLPVHHQLLEFTHVLKVTHPQVLALACQLLLKCIAPSVTPINPDLPDPPSPARGVYDTALSRLASGLSSLPWEQPPPPAKPRSLPQARKSR